MPESKGERALRQRLIEDVNFLSIVRTDARKQIGEQKEVANKALAPNGTWELSFNREKSLANDFAFLSALPGDGDVSAAAIEEDVDRKGITIRIAANYGDLSSVQTGIESITRVIEFAARQESSCEDSLLKAIVKQSRSRILTRLRSRHSPASKDKTRPSPVRLLQDFLLRANKNTWNKFENLAKVKDLTNTIGQAFINIEAAQSYKDENILSQLLLLIQTFNQLSLPENKLPKLLLHIQSNNKDLQPTVATSLPGAIDKIGKYYRIGKNLASLAAYKHRHLLQRITVACLTPYTNPAPIIEDKAPFSNIAGRLMLKKGHLESLTKSYQAKMDRCQATMKLSEWKVHAEIQILLFYESNKKLNHPRVISSSKNACYLCCLFFKQYNNKYQVSSTHGKIYRKWTIPSCPTNMPNRERVFAAIKRLDKQVLEDIKRSANFNGQTQRARPTHPNESLLFPSPPISTPQSVIGVPSIPPKMPQERPSDVPLPQKMQTLETLADSTKDNRRVAINQSGSAAQGALLRRATLQFAANNGKPVAMQTSITPTQAGSTRGGAASLDDKEPDSNVPDNQHTIQDKLDPSTNSELQETEHEKDGKLSEVLTEKNSNSSFGTLLSLSKSSITLNRRDTGATTPPNLSDIRLNEPVVSLVRLEEGTWCVKSLALQPQILQVEASSTYFEIVWNRMKNSEEDHEHGSSCWVGLKWVRFSDPGWDTKEKYPKGVVDLQKVEPEKELVFAEGSALSGEFLFLKNQRNKFTIKFEFGTEPIDPENTGLN